MRQFPQEALFINLFQRGLLTEQHLEELGRCVANFHKKSLSNEWVRSFGNVFQILRGNSAKLSAYRKIC